MHYTLAQAADAARVSKPTVFRWIKAGRVSAARADDNSYRIDPAELHRFLDANAKATTVTDVKPETDTAQRSVTPSSVSETDLETLRTAVALQAEVEKLKALLETERQRAEEWKGQAHRWATQAERLAIAPPILPKPQVSTWWPFQKIG